MREPLDEIRACIREAWVERGMIPYAELRKRYPGSKEEIDEAVIEFLTDELEEWPEGDPDFEAMMGEIADHAFLGGLPPTWSRKQGAVDLSRFRRKG